MRAWSGELVIRDWTKRTYQRLRRICPDCEGYGEVRAYRGPDDLRICDRCGGDGQRKRKREKALRDWDRYMERMEREYDEYCERKGL